MARSIADQSTEGIKIAARQWPQTAFTYATWANQTTVPVTSWVIGAVYDSGNNAYMQFAGGADGSMFARIQQVIDTTFIGRSTSAGQMPQNVWEHCAFTWDGGTTNAAIKIFQNGTQVDNANGGAGSFTAPYSGSDIALTLGAQQDGAGGMFRQLAGNIADAAIWSTALTAGEVLAISKGVRPYNIRQGSLVGYWPIDGISSPEPDFSGLAKNGVLTGTTKVNGPPMTMFTPRRPSNILPLPTPTAPASIPFTQPGINIRRSIEYVAY